MLMASRRVRHDELGLLELALSIRAAGAENLPQRLKVHIAEVLRQAAKLRDNPSEVSFSPSAEAIALAFYLEHNTDLSDEIANIQSIDELSVDGANHALTALNQSYVSKD